jgi:acyl-CoA dehydrogenase
MRYGGMAQRALETAKAYTAERQAFGEALAEKESLRHRVADAETQLHAARSMVRHAARTIAEGGEGRVPVAMSKVFTANAVQHAVDEAIQLCGGNGIGKDLPLADFYENVRAFRIFDGADEVHRRVIARDALSDVDPSEVAHVTRFQG